MNKYIKSLTIIFISISINASSQNYVSTYAGTGAQGFNNGLLDSSTFSTPFGMCMDKVGNLYIADGGNNCIRKINTATGLITTLAGTGIAGWKDGPSDSAKFNSPSDLCVDNTGNVYVSDFLNQRIRKISSTGMVTTIAGSGVAGFLDGNSSVAKFNYPRGICRDKTGNLYIGDSWNHRIRKIDTAGVVTTYAGGGTSIGVGSVGALVDDIDTIARFYTPSGLAIDQDGNILVADAYNHRIRKIWSLWTPPVVSTFAGINGGTGPGNGGYANGIAYFIRLNTPTEIFIDTNENQIYISDTFNNRIRITNRYCDTMLTFAGNGSAAFLNGLDTLASFNYPRGIVVSNTSGKKVYVVDYNNNSIRVIMSQSTGLPDADIFGRDITIFPNPSSSQFVIAGLNANVRKIEVFNSTGIELFDLKYNNEEYFQIDLSNNFPGIYFIRISNEFGNFTVKKILKQ